MRVLLTGGTGFLGSHVLKQLTQNFIDTKVFTRTKNNPPFYKGDLLKHRDIKCCISDLKPDILIHLAWDVTHGEYWDSPKNDLYKQASFHLFEEFITHGGQKIIAAGTCAEFENLQENTDPLSLVDTTLLTPYGRAKRETFEWLQKRNFPFSWIRIFGIYGDGENPKRFFPQAKYALENNLPFDLKTPDKLYHYLPVEDAAKIFVQEIYTPSTNIIHLNQGPKRTMREWFEWIKNQTDEKERC